MITDRPPDQPETVIKLHYGAYDGLLIAGPLMCAKRGRHGPLQLLVVRLAGVIGNLQVNELHVFD